MTGFCNFFLRFSGAGAGAGGAAQTWKQQRFKYMQCCLGGLGGGRNLNWAGGGQCCPPWESGWRLEWGAKPPQSPSGRESGFAPDKQARSYGKRCFSRREKENAGYFQPG